jgi:hypothetical protein
MQGKRVMVGAILSLLLIGWLILPVNAASVVPTIVAGNPTCDQCCSSCQEIVKIEPPQEGTFGPVTVSNMSGGLLKFDWKSDVPITCVIVKASNNANEFIYPSGVMSDTYLYTFEKYDISHISFCGPKVVNVPEFPSPAIPVIVVIAFACLILMIRKLR